MGQKERERQLFSASIPSSAGTITTRQGSALMQRRLRRRSMLISLGIIAFALAATFSPLPGLQRTLVVVSGTELQEPLTALELRFEQQHPSIQLDLKFQGSQDIINNYSDDRNDFDPAVLIPANGQLLEELSDRWRIQNNSDPFYDTPRPIAKTVLVGIAWSDRGQVLFPNGRFAWKRVEQALQAGNWEAIGGSPEWGSFDFAMTDPIRSNSGQVTLSLMAQSKLGSILNPPGLSSPDVQSLIGLVKRSVYQPPRSTDILLQEFIARGPNDADVATVYESIALHRWQEASTTQGKPYQIYYLDPTVETTSTAAIVRRNVDSDTADAARQFLDFLTQTEQQMVFIQHGFRPATSNNIDLQSVPNSPWSQNIPGAEVNPPGTIQSPPNSQTAAEVIRLWQRAN
jgi:ABC-type molybdate transport system substrate-binding protein